MMMKSLLLGDAAGHPLKRPEMGATGESGDCTVLWDFHLVSAGLLGRARAAAAW